MYCAGEKSKMTIDEFKNALLYAAKDSSTTTISSIDEVDIFRICGIKLIDKNFVDFHKNNLIKIDIDLDNEMISLGYQFLEKNSHLNRWFKRIKYQIIPISLIDKVLISSDRTDFIGRNIAFGLRLERNDPYYLSNPKFNGFQSSSDKDNNNIDDNDDEEEDTGIDTGDDGSGDEKGEPTEDSLVGYAKVDSAIVW